MVAVVLNVFHLYIHHDSCSDVDAAPDCHGEERAEFKSEVIDLPVNLCPYTHLWSWALCSDWKKEIADTNDGNELPLKGGWPFP